MELLGLDPFLSTVVDKVPYLHVLVHRIQSAPPATVVSWSGLHVYMTKSSPLRRGSPTWVNQTHASHLLDLWTHGSPGYTRPTPMRILPHNQATALVHASPTPKLAASINMIWIAFYFLLRPGEYCQAADNHPLCLGHVTFTIGHQKPNTHTMSKSDLFRATNASLTFDNQKNRKRGEVIGHARSGHSTACPVYALSHRCIK